MTLRVLNVVSETVATSTAGIPSAATLSLPLDTAEMIPSTAWIPLAPVPGRHLRQMQSSGEAAMVGWNLHKLHILELNINKGCLVTGGGIGTEKVEPDNSKLAEEQSFNAVFRGPQHFGWLCQQFEYCLSEHIFCWKMCDIIPPWVSVNQDAVQTISS